MRCYARHVVQQTEKERELKTDPSDDDPFLPRLCGQIVTRIIGECYNTPSTTELLLNYRAKEHGKFACPFSTHTIIQ